MLQFDPTHRLSLSEVKAHPWFNGPVALIEDIQAEFNQRIDIIKKENESKRLAKEQEKANRATGGYAATRRQFRKGVVNRGHGEEG